MRDRMKSALARRSRVPQTGAVLSTGAFLAVSMWIGWSEVDLHQILSQRVAPLPTQSHEGVIVFDSDPENCKVFGFDNDSGRIIGLPEKCDDQIITGSDGDPVPLGTLHQMEAIRKSFQR
jgi:hypothetical protein